MAASSSRSLKEYLKRYESGADESKKLKKKKKIKEKSKPLSTGGGVLVLDNDPIWQKPLHLEDAEEEEIFNVDETPQVEEDIEVKRMNRLQALRSLKPYHGINEDGSGWVSIPKPSKPNGGNRDHSPTLHQSMESRRRLDSPSPEPMLSRPGEAAGDLSPPRRRRVDDISPRRRRAKSHTEEVEAGVGLLDDDLSPPRKPGKRSRKGSSEDLSPRRKTRFSPASDLSPPRRTRKRLPDDSSQNLFVPLESNGNANLPYEGAFSSRNKESLVTKKTIRGGILSGKEMREETDRKKGEEKSRFAAIDPLLTGRGAEAVYRDKEGKRISKEELMKSKEKKKEEKPLEWGKGLAQKREVEERSKELELEKERPFARSRDDPELDNMLKERLRWGDPMAHLVKRKAPELILEDLSTNEKMKESGFIVPQTIPTHSWLKRGLDFPPNRYGIRPGRHWDGVDRSNGYEKDLFKRQNEKRATETEAYLWSVSEMCEYETGLDSAGCYNSNVAGSTCFHGGMAITCIFAANGSVANATLARAEEELQVVEVEYETLSDITAQLKEL